MGVASARQLPADHGTEVAFAGRSNVGKSSAINTIANRRNLARTSKVPGRTRELNFFIYNENVRIVDLPGYGYAKVNASMQQAWARLLETYLMERASLRGVFLIMDIRHPLQKFDLMMLDYCRDCHLPLHVLLSKADKLSRSAANKAMHTVSNELADLAPSIQLFSALNSSGIEAARTKLAEWLFDEQQDH